MVPRLVSLKRKLVSRIGLLGGGITYLEREELRLDKLPQIAIERVTCLGPPRPGARVLEGSTKLCEHSVPLLPIDISKACLEKKGLVATQPACHEGCVTPAILLGEGLELVIPIKVEPNELGILRQTVEYVRDVTLSCLKG